jgi:hypothetical protein
VQRDFLPTPCTIPGKLLYGGSRAAEMRQTGFRDAKRLIIGTMIFVHPHEVRSYFRTSILGFRKRCVSLRAGSVSPLCKHENSKAVYCFMSSAKTGEPLAWDHQSPVQHYKSSHPRMSRTNRTHLACLITQRTSMAYFGHRLQSNKAGSLKFADERFSAPGDFRGYHLIPSALLLRKNTAGLGFYP